MTIAVSANKYNCGNNYNEQVITVSAGHKTISIYPEVLGRLSKPRQVAEVSNGVVKLKVCFSVECNCRCGTQVAVEEKILSILYSLYTINHTQ